MKQSRMKIIVRIDPEDIGKLDLIGKSGKASSGYRQNFEFCLNKAIEEFIEKYEKEG